MTVTATTEIVTVPRWLVLGSFPGSGTNPRLTDGIPREATLLPSPGQLNEGCTWQAVAANPVDFCSPELRFEHTTCCFAYAFTYVYVPTEETVELLAGSDDGIAIWVNGKNVHFLDSWRGLELDTDVVPVTLKKGWNALLVKVSQGNAAWGFVLRVRRPERTGKMTFSLNRATTKMGHAQADAPAGFALQVNSGTIKASMEDGRLQLPLDIAVFSDYSARAEGVELLITDEADAVYGRVLLPAMDAYDSLQATVALPAEDCFRAIAAGRTLAVAVQSSLGRHAEALSIDALLTLLLEALSGCDLAAAGGDFAVPPLFRGQPALLEARSLHELTAQGQTIARRPQLASRAYAAAETAGGRLALELAIPAELTDPAIHLYFGDEALRLLTRQVRFVLRELKADPATAREAMLAGMRAVGEGDFPAAVQALGDVLQALAASLPDYAQQQITLVGHAHIDMNWLWNMAETQQVAHDTFRQVLSFMEEFPDFTFSQSQASTYQIIERLDPPMFARIRARVREGRWELLGGMVDEGDTNLSGGEALARTFLLGQRYFLSRFDKMATVGWLPDNFGHIAQLPQLLRLAGITGFYGHRCMPQLGPFIWQGVDGSRVTNYITVTYNGEVTAALRELPARYDPQHGKAIWVYGVGDHGGGPTRRDITRAQFYNTIPGFPKLTFGSATDFFASLAEDARDYPVYTGEMQYIFEGCYTSIARIKEANRRCENTLFGAELLAALLAPRGHAYPRALLEEAWYNVAFNQFHDILCGSAVHESNRESIAAYDLALAKAHEARYSALRFLAARVPTDEGRGQPVVVFNPQPVPQTDIVEAELFSYEQPPAARIGGWGIGGPPEEAMKSLRAAPNDVGQGPYPTLTLEDAAGHPVDAQIVDGKVFPSGYRLKVRFLASEMPACGWRVFYAKPLQAATPLDQSLLVKGTTIETPYLLVKVDLKTGHVTRLYDKQHGREVLARGEKGNVLKVYLEQPHEMSAWELGPVSAVLTLEEAELVRVTETGPVRATIEVWRTWRQSRFIQRIHVYRDVPRVEFELEAHWFERGGLAVDAPTLRVAFPFNTKKGTFTCETPYAPVERPTTGREVPAQRWVDLSGKGGGAVLLNDSKYGHRCEGHVVEMTLLRASYSPDPYPDQGPHSIRYAVLPHGGDWRAAGVAQAGQTFNVPLLALETPPGQPGEEPVAGGLLALTPAACLLSGVKRAEEGEALIIRFAEMHGQPTEAALTLPGTVTAAERVNLLEFPLPDAPAPAIAGNTLTVPVRAHEVITLKVTLA